MVQESGGITTNSKVQRCKLALQLLWKASRMALTAAAAGSEDASESISGSQDSYFVGSATDRQGFITLLKWVQSKSHTPSTH